MVRQFFISAFVIAFLAMSFVVLQNWHISDNNAITFKIKSMLGTVDGTWVDSRALSHLIRMM